MPVFTCDHAEYEIKPLDSDSADLVRFTSLSAFIHAQRQRTLDAYNGILPAHSQVVAFEGLKRVHDIVAYPLRDSAIFASIGRVRLSNAFVTQTQGDMPRVWVRSQYGAYRRTCLRALTLLGVPLGSDDAFDVDHIAARSSVGGNTMVALGLVKSAVNQDWGNLVERLEVAYNRGRLRANRDLSHGRAAKLLGISPPRTPAGIIPVRDPRWAEMLADDLTASGGTEVTASAVRDWTLPFCRQRGALPSNY